jgi:phosphoglycerate dehydrogenase-like enzyme
LSDQTRLLEEPRAADAEPAEGDLPAADQHPFWVTDGIVVLPHIGGPHPQRDSFVARLFADNLRRFLDGKPLEEVVDRDAGY